MQYLQQIVATQQYRYPIEQAERERKSREALLIATARRTARPAPAPGPKRPLVSRIAAALGLF
ncbi:MAG: hypothetical protein ACRDJE_26145 [Dehalococcoidia bacterium]